MAQTLSLQGTTVGVLAAKSAELKKFREPDNIKPSVREKRVNMIPTLMGGTLTSKEKGGRGGKKALAGSGESGPGGYTPSPEK